MAFQELEWHAVDDVDFDDAKADILDSDILLHWTFQNSARFKNNKKR